tara:strand:- start:172 stop:390 length:219 start_codon:yes stop_codon:yes gene_type:complete
VGVVGNIVATVFEQATTMEIVMFLSCFCHGVDKISDHVSVRSAASKKAVHFLDFAPISNFEASTCNARRELD